MTARRSSPSSLSGWDVRPPVLVTKRLVAHRPPGPEDGLGIHYGPQDGDPVGIPAPCARLVAGYWCSCGSGFASISGYEPISRARVEHAPDGEWCGYVDGSGWYLEPAVRRPVESDRRDLQAAVEALPIGTVVERYGTGIAPRFADPVRSDEWSIRSEGPC